MISNSLNKQYIRDYIKYKTTRIKFFSERITIYGITNTEFLFISFLWGCVDSCWPAQIGKFDLQYIPYTFFYWAGEKFVWILASGFIILDSGARSMWFFHKKSPRRLNAGALLWLEHGPFYFRSPARSRISTILIRYPHRRGPLFVKMA